MLMHEISEQKIKDLLIKVSDIVESPENKKKAKTGFMPTKENLLGVGGIPFYVGIDTSIWGAIFGVDLREIYQDDKICLIFQLKRAIYHFKNFKDETPFYKIVYPCLNTPFFEPSLFGVEVIFLPDRDPWIGKKPVINTIKDLDSFKYPNFYKSGLMPRIHRSYEKMKALVGDDWNVAFPQWGRGSFGIACDLRGMSNLLVDMFDNPKFVHKLMRFVTNAHIMWSEERAKFLNTKIVPPIIFNDEVNCPTLSPDLYREFVLPYDQEICTKIVPPIIFNDEVNCPTLSPDLYREFVLPYDQEICNFYGGIHWHSCGNVTSLLYLLKKIGKIYSFHVSAWTDLSLAVKAFGGDVPLNVALHPSDVYESTDIEKTAKLKEIMKTCGNIPYIISPDAVLTTGRDIKEDIKAIKKWIKIARGLLTKK